MFVFFIVGKLLDWKLLLKNKYGRVCSKVWKNSKEIDDGCHSVIIQILLIIVRITIVCCNMLLLPLPLDGFFHNVTLSTVISHALFTMFSSHLSHQKLCKLMPIVFYHGPVPGMSPLAGEAAGEPLLGMLR